MARIFDVDRFDAESETESLQYKIPKRYITVDEAEEAIINYTETMPDDNIYTSIIRLALLPCTRKLRELPAADVLEYDELYEKIEQLYKESKGEEHRAYSKVLDLIIDMKIYKDKIFNDEK